MMPKQAQPITAHSAITSGPKGLASMIGTNLGPGGTLKMLVSGAGEIKITKDGNVLCQEMQIQHPIAQMVARAATAQDDMTGDGTTTTIILIAELMRQAGRCMDDGINVRSLTEGFDLAAKEGLKFLDAYKTPVTASPKEHREVYVNVARTALSTKLDSVVADSLAEIVVNAVACIYNPEQMLDLHMVEVIHMQHKLGVETKFVAGLVLDHGTRHPDMPKRLENCYVLTCNVELEYQKTEDNAQFWHNSAEMREKMARAERQVTERKVQQIIDLKRQVCTPDSGKSFVVINQKGMDPFALDMFAKEGIMGLRRAKKRNMDRLTLACGGQPLNSLDNLTPEDLGFAGLVQETTLGDEKYTFVEEVRNPRSCTILIRGPNKYTIEQIKEGTRDGLRAVKNAIVDKAVVAGAGAFETALSNHLYKFADSVEGRPKLGARAFAESLLVVPKTLAENSGFDVQSTVIALQEASRKQQQKVGLNLSPGEDAGSAMDAEAQGIFDSYCVKRQQLHTTAAISSQLLLVDDIVKAGRGNKKKGQDDPLDE
eukprot:NODE_569_length_1802_cov_164.937910_g560_i0.p1 GENE.NODE_569_length_1802_cov_164.937910_g560_i0~~NODE_569_length_1802_cov_164.937910_g560_i0.p1  ORF type:complete len:541 (+),score=157.68 NODE_569_length_1802_cov_164.937910_g560_i0:112-1734(+)